MRPQTRPVDGIAGQGVGGLLDRPRFGAADRPGRPVGMVADAANAQVGYVRDLATFLIGRLGARFGKVKISGVELSISWLVVRLTARRSGGNEEEAMKYVMLTYQGDAQERQAALSEEEQKQVYADYKGI